MSDTIDLKDDDMMRVLNDPDRYKQMVMDVLVHDPSPPAKRLLKMLEKDNITEETDLLLLEMSDIVPYNFLLPHLREHLGLTITDDKTLISTLTDLKKHIRNEDDRIIIDKIIAFIEGGSELDPMIIPELDLLSMADYIPPEFYSQLMNCVRYIRDSTNITEI